MDDFDDDITSKNEWDIKVKQELDHIKKYRLLSKAGQKAADKTLDAILELEEISQPMQIQNNIIPLHISEQSASAGTGTYLGPESFKTVYVLDNSYTRHTAFAVPVSGDSMEPKYHNGDILLVAHEPMEIGDIGLFTMDGCGYVKKLGNGELISLNHQYNPIPMNDSIICNGKAWRSPFLIDIVMVKNIKSSKLIGWPTSVPTNSGTNMSVCSVKPEFRKKWQFCL